MLHLSIISFCWIFVNKNVLNPKSDIKITESKDLFLGNVERLPETDKLDMLVFKYLT